MFSFAFARGVRVSHSFFLKLLYWLASCPWRLKYFRRASGDPNILWSLTKQPHICRRIKVTSWIPQVTAARRKEIMAQQPEEGPHLCSKAKGDVCCTSQRAAFLPIAINSGIRSKHLWKDLEILIIPHVEVAKKASKEYIGGGNIDSFC